LAGDYETQLGFIVGSGFGEEAVGNDVLVGIC
jgi:hypothetical protein